LAYIEAFAKCDTGLALVRYPEQVTSLYYEASVSLIQQLGTATNDLHRMFVAATEAVLSNCGCHATFGFPPQYWPRALKSFTNGDRTFSGRLDFSVREGAGIKCFEYNADSASCLLECGHTQGLWSKRVGLEGVDAGALTHKKLVSAWKNMGVPQGATIHFLHDSDGEEIYHSLYVKSTAEEAGFACKNFPSVVGFSFDAEGKPLDPDGVPVKYIWKSWSYTTLFTQWMVEDLRRSGTPRIVDICLSKDVEGLFEPLWTAIPASKAILPVLTDMYPNHPNLLLSGWELTDGMKQKGYVTKPISGRIGENVSLFGPGQETAEVTVAGRFERNTHMYQERCDLPSFNGEYVQVNTFVIDGSYGGTVLRVDTSPIMSLMSDIIALRVVMEDHKTTLPEVPSLPRGTRRPSVDAADATWLVPFGSVLGVAPGGVPAYSSYYKSVAKDVYPDSGCYRHQIGDIYYGQRFQGVEFVRRWLIHVKGVTFPDIDNAYQVYGLASLTRVRDQALVPWDTFQNPSLSRPAVGSVLVWGAGDEDLPHLKLTGHIAIVCEVSDDYVRVAEQNVDDTFWPPNQSWGRQLPACFDKETGLFSIPVAVKKGRVQGWKTLPASFVPEPIPVTVDGPEVLMAEKLLKSRSMKPLVREGISDFPKREISSSSFS
jgi:glutathionylspermidine synthase